MISNRFFHNCALAFMLLGACAAGADDATITLDLSYSSGAGTAGTWQLLGRVDDTAGVADGQFGLASVRALVDGIDFGTNGNAISFAPGTGAGSTSTVLQQVGGTIELIYFQDLSESETSPGSGVFNSVVTNVGNSGDTLLASGIFSAGFDPAFGQDDTGASTLFTEALFLTNGTSPFSGTIDADNTFTLVTDNLSGGIPGDANNDGAVDLLDLDILGTNFGSSPATLAQGDFNGDNVVDLLDLDILGTNFGTGSGLALSVPEPGTLALALVMGSLTFCCRRNI